LEPPELLTGLIKLELQLEERSACTVAGVRWIYRTTLFLGEIVNILFSADIVDPDDAVPITVLTVSQSADYTH